MHHHQKWWHWVWVTHLDASSKNIAMALSQVSLVPHIDVLDWMCLIWFSMFLMCVLLMEAYNIDYMLQLHTTTRMDGYTVTVHALCVRNRSTLQPCSDENLFCSCHRWCQQHRDVPHSPTSDSSRMQRRTRFNSHWIPDFHLWPVRQKNMVKNHQQLKWLRAGLEQLRLRSGQQWASATCRCCRWGDWNDVNMTWIHVNSWWVRWWAIVDLTIYTYYIYPLNWMR